MNADLFMSIMFIVGFITTITLMTQFLSWVMVKIVMWAINSKE